MAGLLATLLIYGGPLGGAWYASVAWPRSQARIDFWRRMDCFAFRVWVKRENKLTTRLTEYCESKYFAGTEVTSNPTPIRR